VKKVVVYRRVVDYQGGLRDWEGRMSVRLRLMGLSMR